MEKEILKVNLKCLKQVSQEVWQDIRRSTSFHNVKLRTAPLDLGLEALHHRGRPEFPKRRSTHHFVENLLVLDGSQFFAAHGFTFRLHAWGGNLLDAAAQTHDAV